MNSTLTIHGCGGHARSVANTALKTIYQQLQFIDENARPHEMILGFPVISGIEGPLPLATPHIVGLGDNDKRQQLYDKLKAAGCDIINLVAYSALVGQKATWGSGNFIAESAYLGPEVRLGDNNIINTRSIIEHECIIGSHNHIAINATVAGRCKIGDFVMIGAGATVVDGTTIGSHSVIGAGAVVVKDIVEPGVYVGVPARKL